MAGTLLPLVKPSGGARGHAGGSGAVPLAWQVPNLLSLFPVATGFLLTPALSITNSASTYPALVPVLTQEFFSGAGVGHLENAAANF